MKLTYKDAGLSYSVNSISSFLTEGETSFWSGPIFYFYPQIDKDRLKKEGEKYLTCVLSSVYEELRAEIEAKTEAYGKNFEAHKEQIEDALSEAFQLDTRALFNDLTVNVTLNPISPRYLQERTFDVFYKNSERGALGVSLHEMIHFLWFYVWNGRFCDGYGEYERPSLKWILSEAVVESVMRDQRLSSLNPYFPREHGGCVYPYFFNMKADGELVLTTLDKMYKSSPIVSFMESSYEYFQKHEKEIRAHIERSEK